MSWIRADENGKKPEQGKKYWITVMAGMRPHVLMAEFGRKFWRLENGDRIYSKVEAWWDKPVFIPTPYRIPEPPKYRFPEFEVNDKGMNVKLSANILPDEEMRRAGFTDYAKDRWYFCRGLQCDNTLEFSVTIPKENPVDFSIMLLNSDFCQPYDYQGELMRNAENRYAGEVMKEVEKFMAYLGSKGIIDGHVRGEYI